MIVSPFALLLPLLVSVSPALAAEFTNKNRCGDCWCITDPANGNTCPTDTVGIADSFSTTDLLYSTFELANDPEFLKLQSASGGPCFPFADAFNNEALANYPQSDADQCVFPEGGEETVCAYVYDGSSTTCEGRKYRIQNFPGTEEAMGSNAAILHQGGKKALVGANGRRPCGVWSRDIQQFASRFQTLQQSQHYLLHHSSTSIATPEQFSYSF